MRKKIQNMYKQEKGLTLVELLAVIVVLGIIAAIAVPSINGIINDTEVQAREAVAIQLYEAARLSVTISNTDVSNNEDDVVITLSDLDDSGFLSGVVDPATGEALNVNDTNVTFAANGESITVNYVEDTNSIEEEYVVGEDILN
ncbi:type II secretion system protein [Chengkuizengella marina]|uniref:Type II secretion system protein n=1 Tax=Chengkuizengella marina TaxID=2507566 RepID=A0A6N9Q1F2_9BACL|nr:type II secretion system protein [Chengkuizengella marina]NBI28000.1 type II secretion system protein [Chengkuizengella marina]